MADVLCLYFDDSGTRNPDRAPQVSCFRDWFSLGGVLIDESDEALAKKLHTEFCARWNITKPLHSFKIRNRSGPFAWLNALSPEEYQNFMEDLAETLAKMPVTGHACVIDRNGYNHRYRDKFGSNQWMLCKTAFTVLCERAAKIAKTRGKRLRIYPEDGDPTANEFVERYYREMMGVGMPFDASTSAIYKPMKAEDFRGTFYGLRFKKKSSPLAQIADLYLYPTCRGRYEPSYKPYQFLREKKKLVDDVLPVEEVSEIGIKYSCFELVRS